MAMSYKGAISFGLIYIPITLHIATRSNTISFNMIDKKTMSRIRYRKTCTDCNDQEVKKEDIVKGYEYVDGKFVIFDNEDFEKIKSKRDKTITIESFVKLSDIDPIYFNRTYYVVPGNGADTPFALLKKAMAKGKKVGIAKTVMGTKETLIAIRVLNDIMYLNTLNFHEEIQDPIYVDVKSKVNKQEVDLATTLINNMTKPFKPEEHKDEYRIKVEQAIQAKIAGKEFVITEDADANQALDLMTALQQSLKNIENSPQL